MGRFLLGVIENVLKLDRGGGYITVHIQKPHRIIHLK